MSKDNCITDSEIWKDVVGYEGSYQVSNVGRVKSLDRWITTENEYHGLVHKHKKERIMVLHSGNTDHLKVTLTINGQRKTYEVHSLVLKAFVGLPPEGMECCHNDGDASNNKLENLRWDTHKSNMEDRTKHGGQKMIGILHPKCKLTEENVIEIRRLHKTVNPTVYKLCKMFKVSQSSIEAIIQNRTWKHLLNKDNTNG